MINYKKLKLSCVKLLLVTLCLGTSYLFAYERADLMEPGVNLVFRISNGAALMKGIKNSPLGRLWNSPEMNAFLDNQSLEETLLKSIFTHELPEAKKEEAVNLYRQIFSLFKGEIAAGIIFGEKAGEIKFFVLAEMDETGYKKTGELYKKENILNGKNPISQRHTFQEVELVQTITRDKGVEKVEWLAFFGNTFINSSHRQWVEKCIVELKKELPRNPIGPPSFRLWLPEGFIDHFLKWGQGEAGTVTETPVEQPPASDAMMKALGLTGIGELSLEWKINPAYSEVNFRVKNRGEHKGLWTLFSADPIPRKHSLGYVPGSIFSYQVVRLNLHAFWQQMPDMFAAVEPQSAADFQFGLKAISQMLQVDIDRDIFANFDNILTYCYQLEGLKRVILYVWQLRNPRAMEKTLSKLFAEGSYLRSVLKENFEALNLQDHMVYCIKVPRFAPPSPTGGESPGKAIQVEFSSYGIAVVDGDLLTGPLNLVRSYIHGSRDGKSAREFYRSPMYTRMMRRIPDNVSGYGLFDITQLVGPMVNLFKTIGTFSGSLLSPGKKAEKKPGLKNPPSPFEEFFKNLKYDKLPGPDFLRSFFGPWLNYYQFNGRELMVRIEFHDPLKK